MLRGSLVLSYICSLRGYYNTHGGHNRYAEGRKCRVIAVALLINFLCCETSCDIRAM